jgi:hypothetical protein
MTNHKVRRRVASVTEAQRETDRQMQKTERQEDEAEALRSGAFKERRSQT